MSPLLLPAPMAVMAVMAVIVRASTIETYTYDVRDAVNGPSQWPGACASGRRQSPINFDAAAVIVECNTDALRLEGYDEDYTFSVHNNGRTVSFSGEWSASMSGGRLEHTYDLVGMHLHWAPMAEPWIGSEHLLTHLSYPLEAHFVHKRRDIATVEEALNYGDGLAVLGVQITVLREESDRTTYGLAGVNGYDPLVQSLRIAHQPHSAPRRAPRTLNLRSLLPTDMSAFYRYEGSLTTPPCSEAVIWSVMSEPVAITPEQFQAFHDLIDTFGERMQNHRPPQPINGRKVWQLRPAQSCNITDSLTLLGQTISGRARLVLGDLLQ